MAAPEFTLFVKPYLEGWDNGEEGNTPITAEILNDNYDAFLLALNEWATSIGLLVDGIPTKTSDLTNDSNFIADASYVHTDNNYTTTEKNKLSGIEANANNYSLPTASTSTLGGVKVDGITVTIANGVISAVGGGGTDVEGNPSGTPTAVLSSIRIGNDIFSIPGGSSGGSTVSYSQILATGTKIGTITIDGVPTDIYAPTPPAKTSDLTNDSNFVSDANYVHTDNNYTTTEKNKLSGLATVEANPSSGTSAGDLTSIEIDGTKYNIPSGGGGGTTVIANPSGSATAGDLNKLQVGNDIYQIPSGSGSQEITPISNVDYANLTPQQKTNGQVYLVSSTPISPDYTASNWQFASEYPSAYAASIDDNKLVFKTLSGGGSYNSYACAMYKTGIDLTNIDHITVIANITYIGSPREIQIGVIDTLPSIYTYDPTFSSYETLTEGSWALPIDKTIELDTSELTGTYYFGVKASGKTVFTAESILFYFDDSNIPNEIYHMNKKFSQYPGASGGTTSTDLTDILVAGATTLTFSNPAIVENTFVECYTSKLGVNPIAETHSIGSITLTFEAQSQDIQVGLRISPAPVPKYLFNYANLSVTSQTIPHTGYNWNEATFANKAWRLEFKTNSSYSGSGEEGILFMPGNNGISILKKSGSSGRLAFYDASANPRYTDLNLNGIVGKAIKVEYEGNGTLNVYEDGTLVNTLTNFNPNYRTGSTASEISIGNYDNVELFTGTFEYIKMQFIN